MGGAGRPGRGERARVAARVRALVDTATSAALPSDDEAGDEPEAWVPGMRPPARRAPEPAPGWRAKLRWDPGRRGLIALGLAVVVIVAGTGWWLASARPAAMPITAVGDRPVGTPTASGGPSAIGQPTAGPASPLPAVTPGPPAVPSASASVVVDVAGKVRRPGVYTLPTGARVYEALRAAGGVRGHAGTLALNLAALLQDGEQIVVGGPSTAGVAMPAPPAVGGATTGAADASAAPVDLNTATLDQLEALPGVGPVLGQNILDWRAAHQQFTSVDQLRDVSGIGDVRLAQLRPLVTV